MRIPSAAECSQILASHGWVEHREPGRLNILILRRVPGTWDAFDDMIVQWRYAADGSIAKFQAARCTADPGKEAAAHPTRRDGTARWAVGQELDGLKLGLHHPDNPGAYPCLRPVRPLHVLRFSGLADDTGTPSVSDTVQIHHASATHESQIVGAWSLACCVLPNPDDYDQFLGEWDRQDKLGMHRFTVSCVERANDA